MSLCAFWLIPHSCGKSSGENCYENQCAAAAMVFPSGSHQPPMPVEESAAKASAAARPPRAGRLAKGTDRGPNWKVRSQHAAKDWRSDEIRRLALSGADHSYPHRRAAESAEVLCVVLARDAGGPDLYYFAAGFDDAGLRRDGQNG